MPNSVTPAIVSQSGTGKEHFTKLKRGQPTHNLMKVAGRNVLIVRPTFSRKDMPFWVKTSAAVDQLTKILTCNICNNIMKDPYSVINCDHSFCRTCITKAINAQSKCPECGSFAWLKDLQSNRELGSAVEFCMNMQNMIALPLEDSTTERCFEVHNESKEDNFEERAEENYLSWPSSGKQAKKSLKTYSKKHASKLSAANSDAKRSQTSTKFEDPSTKENLCEDSDCAGLEPDRSICEENGADNEGNENDTEPLENRNIPTLPRRRQRKRENVETANKGLVGTSGASSDKKGKSDVKKTRKEVRSSRRSSVMKVNKKGETPLHVAAIKGKYDQVKELLDQGADPNAKDFAGWTPLHEACNHGCFEIVQLLLDKGAFIDVPGCDNDTPLHDAIANRRLEVAEFLISKGASLDVRNRQGLLPMDYVISNVIKEQLMLAAAMAQEAREAGEGDVANLSTISLKSNTPLPKCILYTGINGKGKKTLEKSAKTLDAKLVDEFNSDVTHIVTSVNEDNVCTRTMKFLRGILTGKWIVSLEWASESLKKHKWQDEESFEVNGCTECADFIPKKARINFTKQFPPLFDGCSFYLSGDFKSSPSKTELLELIQLGGGQILHREPKAETAHPLITPSSPAAMKIMSTKAVESPIVAYHAKPDTAQSYCTQYIIYDPESCPSHKRLSTPIMCTAKSSWILDCISKFELLEIKNG